ncbi:unnamed protein product [Prorocentrum cordatum]|uniref:RanBP-type and C3HC4-type zinc finger-containing protein 1 n=1 Tax=Prorocentrum cordatum TaxID=2364126 RepID=A0ABN9PB77_9DINO|nr:unnamed protein product [Polarella glacialis]
MSGWSCGACTLENHAGAASCEVCGAPRPPAAGNAGASQWACAQCTLLNPIADVACCACGALRLAAAGSSGGAAAARRSKKGRVRSGCVPPRAGRGRRRLGRRAARRLPVPRRARVPDLPGRPSVPRLTECGHAFCLLCALRHMEISRACPVCTAAMRLDDLRPVSFELIDAFEEGADRRFLLVRRSRLWLELASCDLSGYRYPLTLEGRPGWLLARRVIADPGARLSRLHAECRELEAAPQDPLAQGALDALRAQLPSATAASERDVSSSAAERVEQFETGELINFYQSDDGQLAFLENAVTKQLLARFGRWGDLPPEVTVRVRGTRSETLSDELRRRHRFLDHLRGGEVTFVDGQVLLPAGAAGVVEGPARAASSQAGSSGRSDRAAGPRGSAPGRSQKGRGKGRVAASAGRSERREPPQT